MSNEIQMVLSADTAKRLADWYLPTNLRDFWLGMHPLIQTYIYQRCSSGAEFFTNIQMEAARLGELRRVRRGGNDTYSQGIEMIPWKADPRDVLKIGVEK